VEPNINITIDDSSVVTVEEKPVASSEKEKSEEEKKDSTDTTSNETDSTSNNSSSDKDKDDDSEKDETSTSVIPTFKELDMYTSASYPFDVSDDGKYLYVNIFCRGGTNGQTPDTFLLQNDKNKGEFPIGTWISVKDKREYLEINSTTIIRYSPHFKNSYYTYTIADSAFNITNFETRDE
jgi:hypothetical protein